MIRHVFESQMLPKRHVQDALRERAEPATLVIEAGRITGVLAPGAAVGADTEMIDATGKLAKVWPKVKPEGHAAEVLEALSAL